MRKNKFILTFIAVVLLNAVVAFGWYYIASTINNSDIEILRIRRQIKDNEGRLDSGASLERLVSLLGEEKDKINAVFLSRQNIIDFIEKIELIADRAGTSLKFGQINVDSPKEESPKVDFVVKGSFEEIYHFLVLLENNSYTVAVEKMSFQKMRDDEWQAVFNVLVNNFRNS